MRVDGIPNRPLYFYEKDIIDDHPWFRLEFYLQYHNWFPRLHNELVYITIKFRRVNQRSFYGHFQ